MFPFFDQSNIVVVVFILNETYDLFQILYLPFCFVVSVYVSLAVEEQRWTSKS